MQSQLETRLLINGKFVKSASGKTFKTIDPKTEKVIAEVYEASKEDVDKAVTAARAAFPDWSTSSGVMRRDLMTKLADLMEEDIDELAQIEAADSGKTFDIAKNVDITLAIKCLRYYAGWADKLQGKQVPIEDTNFMCITKREPVGVVGQIIPWNFPILMMAWKIAPALACGCTIVLKSSEKTPLSCLRIGQYIKQAGFPAGVVNLLSGFGPTCGAEIAKHMDIDKVAFTGSSMVGKLVHKMAGESNLKRCSLELGGKSPMIVFDDADLEQAVSAAQLGLFLNSGQCCIAGSRLYVQENIYDAFVKLAVEKAQSGQGNWEDQPIVDKMQFEKVMGYIEAGKRDGAVLKCGGKRSRSTGYFIKPTVFANVNEKMLIGHEEIFGPVMSILKFKTIDEVIKRANNSIYGLGAGVCTRDIGKALHVANHMRAGTVYVNCYDKFDTAAPFGGFKESGHGRELGEAGLDNYCENKTIVISVDLPKEVGTSSGSKKSSKKKFESDSEDEDSMLVLTPFANGSSRHDASDDEGQVFKVIKKKKM